MALNYTIMQGRMVADPEWKETNSGSKVVNFRIAWSEKYKEKENKCFLECKAFDTKAEFICRNFKKGQAINVEGRLNTETWTTQDGQNRSKTVLYISNVHFGESKQNSSVQPNMTPVEEPEGLPF